MFIDSSELWEKCMRVQCVWAWPVGHLLVLFVSFHKKKQTVNQLTVNVLFILFTPQRTNQEPRVFSGVFLTVFISHF